MEVKPLLLVEHDRLRVYEDGAFRECSAPEIKKLPSGAIVPLSLLQTHTLKLSSHLSLDELRLQAEIRMFEEGNLNPDEEYTIDFIRHPMSDENSVLVEIFALPHAKADEYFGEATAKTGAIDRIVPGFLIYTALYPNPQTQNDLYIHWGEEEAYAVLYQNGHYIAHRSIETLPALAVTTGLELQKLKSFLHTKGIVEENYLPEELSRFILLQNQISRNIERIVHTINHKRGLFGISGIDRCYLDFEGKTIPGLEEAFSAYGIPDLSIQPLLHRNTANEQIHDALSADYLILSKPHDFNLTPYPRKAPWYARESGKFLGLVGAALLIVLATSLYVGWLSGAEEERHEQLNARLQQLHQETSSLASTLKTNRNELAALQTNAQTLEDEISLYRNSEETADLVHDMHAARQKFLLDTTAELGRYRLGAMLMEQNGSKEMAVHVIADPRRRDDIARFMTGLYERGYQNAQTHEIKLDDGRYGSLVKVTR